MPPSFQDYLAEIKASIHEITVHELQELMAGPEGPVVIDIREPEEVANGVIPGAEVVPRGFLELRVEGLAPERDRPLAIYCAGGTRSALAARAVQALGYERVMSVGGGLGAWSRAGFPLEQRQQMTVEQLSRYARQIILPQLGEEGQQRLLDARVLCVGAGGLGSPAALYLAAAGVAPSASWTTTRPIYRTCNVRYFTMSRP